ncbi:MAG: c-type cytochrome [Magnetococcales bacterium]|nr:c-type cytochrome [Magnetococcales bacterium]
MRINSVLFYSLMGIAVLAVSDVRADLVDEGEVVFKKCATCHNITDDGTKKSGPNLGGVMGRKAGTLKGFAFSPAMTASKLIWNRETLDRFLAQPTTVVPSSKMVFPGLKGAHDRDAVITFLEAQSES